MFNRSTRNKHGPNSETLEDDARVLKIFRECLRFIYRRVDDKNVYIINGEHTESDSVIRGEAQRLVLDLDDRFERYI